MRGSAVRLLTVSLVLCCMTGLAISPVLALGQSSGAASGSDVMAGTVPSALLASQSTSLRSPAIPGVQGLEESLQAAVVQQAWRDSPAAAAAREVSRTKFAHLGAARAAEVAREAFPEAIDLAAGGPPPLAAGERVVGYPGTDVARLALPGGKHVVVESMEPMAIETSRGHRAPVDLGLTKAGDVYESVRPVVGVLIPQRLSDGVALLEKGVSLTPVDAQGSSLGGSAGAIDGTGVLYANTQTDTDTLVKPTTEGFEADTVLRSVDSPGQLYFRVGLPSGASLVQGRGGGSAPVMVVQDGRTIAHVSPPSATDATGTPVPVSMTVRGDVLALTVASHSGEHLWPIEVDPELRTGQDESIGPAECHKPGEAEHPASNWCVEAFPPFKGYWYEHTVDLESTRSYSSGEYIAAVYHTQGESRIYELKASTISHVVNGRAKLEIAYEGSLENKVTLAEKESFKEKLGETLCAGSCSPTAPPSGYKGNTAAYKVEAIESSSEYLAGALWDTDVLVAQEKAPEVSLNTSEEHLKEDSNRENVAYGSGKWLSPTSGAFEFTVHDPGIGVSRAGVSEISGGYHSEERIHEAGKCVGIQCEPTFREAVAYSPEMTEGEEEFEMYGEDMAGLFGYIGFHEGHPLIKVDAKPPYNIGFTGMLEEGAEITAAPHTLTVHATDGTKPTVSSGVKSIAVAIDGGPQSVLSGTSCSPGECTVSGKYTLDAEDLNEGVHRLVVTATDNAGNVAAKEFTFDVRHGSPVSVGPGSVDPTTGQLKLSATDVSLAGSGGVSRVYESRNLSIGSEGPLGPQWAISLGGGENMTELPSGSIVLSGSSGGTTTFLRKEKGEFESPLGDGNLKVEAKEKEAGKGITEYLLINASAGTTTRFTQPEGTESTIPVYTNQFGKESYGLKSPIGVAVGANGDAWVADTSNNRIMKYSSGGTLLLARGSEGPFLGEFNGPHGVAINQTTGNVYVVDEGNNRIVELNSSGESIRTFGWDVKPGGEGANEFQVCTSYCKAGTAGSGIAQFKEAKGIAVDSSGDVWVADYGNNRIEEFNETGGYIQEFGTEGTGEGQLKGPFGVAFSGGNLYVSEYGNDRVQELSTAGKYIYAWGKAGSGNGEFNGLRGIATDPRSGYLYVDDTGNDRVQEFTAAGKFVVQFGTAGSGNGQFSEPKGVAVNSSGGVYVADTANNRVQEWSRPTWLPTLAEGALKSVTTSYGYGPVEEEGKTVVLPTEALAAAPAGVECGTKPSELKKGCRALTFVYSTEKTASGENPTEWGQYKGRLSKVVFHAYNPAKGAEKMEEKTVAEYSYDSKGRLRAEWDPRISPNLKTTYGYDAEGHVTALTPPSQQGWVLTYGTNGVDSSTGRLLKVTRAQPKAGASEEKVKEVLREQELTTKNTVAPKLSGTAVVGVTMGVSSGTWSDSPVAYGYQWEDCNSEGKSCTPILGATNANYKVASSDVGHTLVAQVNATNGGGAVMAASSASAVVASSGTKTEGTSYAPEPGSTIEYHVPISGTGLPTLTKEEVEKWGQKDRSEKEDNDPVEGVAVFPPDKPMGWPATTYERATIDYMNEKGLRVNTASPTGGIATSEYNEANEVIRTLSADNRAAALKETGKTAEASEKLDTKTEYNPEDTQILKVTGPEHKVKLTSGSEVEARGVTRDYYDEGAEEAEAKNKEEYNLVTKTTSAALLSSGKEEDTRTTMTSYSGQEDLGWKLRKPTSVTTDPGGLALTSGTVYNPSTGDVVETQTPGANDEAASELKSFSSFGGSGSGGGALEKPVGVAVDSSGNVWVADTGHDRVQEFNSKGEFVREFGAEGKEDGEFKEPRGIAVSAAGNVYVADDGNKRVQEFNSKGEFIRTIGSEGTGEGKFENLVGVAVDGEGHVWTLDRGSPVYEGGYVPRVEEFTAEGVFMKQFGKEGKEKGEFKEPKGIAVDSKGDVWVSDTGNERVQEFKSSGEWVRAFGAEGTGNGQFEKPIGLAFDSEGDLWVADSGNDRVQRFTGEGSYLSQVGKGGNENGQFNKPEGIATSSGKIIAADTGNNRVETWTPEHRFVDDAKTIYYTAKEEAAVATCRNHPEWANLPCETSPAAQPGDGISMPVKALTYNMWDEVETTAETYAKTEKFTATTRTITQTYDAAGRALTSEETSSPANDTALPKVTNEYNTETGALEKQSATIGGKTKTITSKTNTLGQLASYTDAEGKTSKYAYDIDGRVEEMSYEIGKETFSQIYAYNSTTGFLTSLYDTGMKKYFTATYDGEGKMLTEVYPNGMTAAYAYNSTGAADSLEYVAAKASGCTGEGCIWFKDAVTPSIHGETLIQVSSLSKENYVYDKAGRLTETQETPTGKGCKSRLYAYNEESDRTSETTRESATETCASTGGTTQTYSYDEANRLIDSGVEYETFGNTTKVPAADAEEHELTSTYYVDGQVATQKQNEETLEYVYDPAGRAMETKSKGKTAATVISHYSGSGAAPMWTSEEEEKKWSRNIPGIDGALDAIETSSGSTTLQLHDLEGDIIGEAAVSETETKLLKTYNSTEFGVPSEGKAPPKYAWLGAGGVASEPSFGTGTITQGGASYVPQLARNLQTDPVIPPGAFPNGSGTGSEASSEIPGWYTKLSEEESAATRAEYQKKLEEEAAKALQQCQEEGTCVNIEDPPWVHHYDQQEAEVLLDELKVIHGGLEIAGLFGLADDLTKPLLDVVEGFIQDNFTVDAIEDWAKNLESQVEGCLTDIDFWVVIEDDPTCRVSIPSIKIEFVIETVELPEYWHDGTVSWCADGETYCLVE